MGISFHWSDSGRIHLRSNMHVPLGKWDLHIRFFKIHVDSMVHFVTGLKISHATYPITVTDVYGGIAEFNTIVGFPSHALCGILGRLDARKDGWTTITRRR